MTLTMLQKCATYICISCCAALPHSNAISKCFWSTHCTYTNHSAQTHVMKSHTIRNFYAFIFSTLANSTIYSKWVRNDTAFLPNSFSCMLFYLALNCTIFCPQYKTVMRLCSSHITFNVERRVLLSVFVCLSVYVLAMAWHLYAKRSSARAVIVMAPTG